MNVVAHRGRIAHRGRRGRGTHGRGGDRSKRLTLEVGLADWAAAALAAAALVAGFVREKGPLPAGFALMLAALVDESAACAWLSRIRTGPIFFEWSKAVFPS